jgi:predicted Zn-dependent protease
LVGPVLAVSSISGYSQALESEADEIAFQRLLKAGYDTNEAVTIFQKMAAETEALNLKEPFFFSTHPRMVERVESFQRMHNESGREGGFKGKQNYLDLTMPLRVSSLEEDLAMGRYKSVLLALENDEANVYPEYTKYQLGEAYRQRGKDGDLKKALDAYNEAVLRVPDYAPSYRALGYHYFKTNENDKAKKYFERYLELAPEGKNQDYVLFYLDQIEDRSKE